MNEITVAMVNRGEKVLDPIFNAAPCQFYGENSTGSSDLFEVLESNEVDKDDNNNTSSR